MWLEHLWEASKGYSIIFSSSELHMKDNYARFFKFIDFSDIREYDRNTNFTLVEWTLLVAVGMKR